MINLKLKCNVNELEIKIKKKNLKIKKMTKFVMTNNVIMLNSKLKILRLSKGLKTHEIASYLSIDQSLISKFESGTRKPTKDQIAQLNELFGCVQNELINIWISEKIIEEIKEYEYADDVMHIVQDAIAGYQKLLNKPKHQDLPKSLIKILNDIEGIKKQINDLKPLNRAQLKNLNDYFFTEYTYESNKIEGNTLSLQETAMVIKEGLTIGGKSVKEHLEAINHKEAIEFVYEIANKQITLNERTIKEIHYLILKGIYNHDAGKYRETEVRISGSKHEPPIFFDVPLKMSQLVQYFNMHQNQLHPVILAADIHQILVGIHPFIDGNGRTSRLLMNLILLQNGYYIANIKGNLSSRMKYYEALEKAHINGQLNDFRVLVAKSVKHSLTEFYKLIK
jgi:Fic family protein/DNA-binding transcriptional regulator YiaG